MERYNCTLPKLRTYKGSRYIPVFAEPLQWDAEREYEWLTVVYNCGRTYISKTRVPSGTELPEYPLLTNDYWATYADYNAQIEQYRAEVRSFSLRYDKLFCHLKSELERVEQKLDDAVTTINNRIDNEVNTLNQAISSLNASLTSKIDQVSQSLTQQITEVRNESGAGISDIVEKVYMGGTVGDDGSVTWPTADKIAIGNMNWYAGSANEHYIKTAADGNGDMRAE